MRYEHPWCPKSYAPAILLLPCGKRSLFDLDRVADCNDIVGKLAVETLAMSGQFALSVSVLSSRGLIALRILPLLFALFDAPLCVVVLRVIGSALPLHFPLQAAFLAGVGG